MNKNGDEDLKKMIFNNISFFGSIPFYEEWIKQNLEEYTIGEIVDVVVKNVNLDSGEIDLMLL